MNTKTKLFMLLVAAVMVVAACSPPAPQSPDIDGGDFEIVTLMYESDLNETMWIYVVLPPADQKDVLPTKYCVFFKKGYGGGQDCSEIPYEVGQQFSQQ